jgi:hypothetical protein
MEAGDGHPISPQVAIRTAAKKIKRFGIGLDKSF